MSGYYYHLFNHVSAREHPLLAIKLALPKFLKSLTNFNKPCIGCHVQLKDGRKCWISNGTSYPIWDLITDDINRERIQAYGTEFKILRYPENIWYCATYTYNWWISSWFDIEINKRIGYLPWP